MQRLLTNWALCCDSSRAMSLPSSSLTTDPHSPAEFRANVVRNLDEFHTAYGTVPEDGLWLDSDDRVRIW